GEDACPLVPSRSLLRVHCLTPPFRVASPESEAEDCSPSLAFRAGAFFLDTFEVRQHPGPPSLQIRHVLSEQSPHFRVYRRAIAPGQAPRLIRQHQRLQEVQRRRRKCLPVTLRRLADRT